MSKLIKLSKNLNIGGYSLPADFQCVDNDFLSSLLPLTFVQRANAIFTHFTGKTLSDNAFDCFEDKDFLASVISVDDGLNILELFDGKNLSYEDYVFSSKTPIEEVASLVIPIISGYIDLVDSECIKLGEKINIVSSVDDGRILLALYLLKLALFPINTLILGSESEVQEKVKGLYFECPQGNEVGEISNLFYEDFDYVFDPITAASLVSYDCYLEDFDDESTTLILALISPYLFARKIVKTLYNKNEISVDNALKIIFNETGLEVPNSIKNKQLQPFYKNSEKLSVKDAIKIIKNTF